MTNYKRKEKKRELYKCLCCKGCTKQCLSNGRIAVKEIAIYYSEPMLCNNTTELSFKEDKLTPSKSSR